MTVMMFTVQKSRNDFSFLWDDDMNEMKGKVGSPQSLTIYNSLCISQTWFSWFDFRFLVVKTTIDPCRCVLNINI